MKRRERKPVEYNFVRCDRKGVIAEIGKETLVEQLKSMLLIRNFEVRAEAAYKQGKIGGFFHSYIGQEAIQTGAIAALGLDNWYTTTYRCHALALLTGVTPNEAMAELFGKATGNAMGRGGSMHMFSDCLLGGFGIVGGHTPIAAGAAFSLAYQKKKGVSLCFLGDGATAQGAFHESLNLVSLWDLPCIYVIENNQWGMGTGAERAIAKQPIAENLSNSYDMEGYSLDGMDFFDCYHFFQKYGQIVQETQRPILVEAVTERFKGHSISDPGFYRSKDDLDKVMQSDPIHILRKQLIEENMLTEEEFEELNKQQKQIVLDAIKFADESPWPDLATLEEDIFAP